MQAVINEQTKIFMDTFSIFLLIGIIWLFFMINRLISEDRNNTQKHVLQYRRQYKVNKK